MQTHFKSTGNKLIKLIKHEGISAAKQTHKTHQLIFAVSEEISTAKQTHKTHKTHFKSTGNKLIKLIKTAGKIQTHEFGNGGTAPKVESGRLQRVLIPQHEFYEFPPTQTREENSTIQIVILYIKEVRGNSSNSSNSYGRRPPGLAPSCAPLAPPIMSLHSGQIPDVRNVTFAPSRCRCEVV